MRIVSCMFFAILASCNAASNSSVENPYYTFGICPTNIMSPPPLKASVRFSNNEVDLGNYIQYYLTPYQPRISYKSEPKQLYTIIVVDLDVPAGIAPYQAPYLIWMVVNIPGTSIVDGDCITVWIPPTPSPGSGFHRYLFLVYKQTSRINPNTSNLLTLPGRLPNFSINEFSRRYRLGTPIAGNFFISRISLCDDQTSPDIFSSVKKCA